MRVYSWLALTCLLLAPSAAQADEAKHCGLLLATSLNMQFDDRGAPLVPVSIEQKDKLLLVDTGGIYSMLTDAAVDDLGLLRTPLLPGGFRLLNGKALSGAAMAQSFRIGRMQLSRYSFLVLPTAAVSAQTAGVLAPDIMRRFDIEFDFSGGLFKVFSQDHCEGNVVYWTQDGFAALPFDTDNWGHIISDANLDGEDMKVTVDTGSTRTVMTLSGARRIFGWPSDSPELKRLDTGRDDGDALYKYPFKTLSFQGVTVRNPDIILIPDKLNDPALPPLILGMTVLRKLHLYIAYKEKKIYLTPADAR